MAVTSVHWQPGEPFLEQVQVVLQLALLAGNGAGPAAVSAADLDESLQGLDQLLLVRQRILRRVLLQFLRRQQLKTKPHAQLQAVVENFVETTHVVLGQAGDQLHAEARLPRQRNGAGRPLRGAGAAQTVLNRGRSIDADLQQVQRPQVVEPRLDQHPVRVELADQSALLDMTNDLADVAAYERLASGERNQADPRPPHLVHHVFHGRRVEFLRAPLVLPLAVAAAQVAAPRDEPGHRHRSPPAGELVPEHGEAQQCFVLQVHGGWWNDGVKGFRRPHGGVSRPTPTCPRSLRLAAPSTAAAETSRGCPAAPGTPGRQTT